MEIVLDNLQYPGKAPDWNAAFRISREAGARKLQAVYETRIVSAVKFQHTVIHGTSDHIQVASVKSLLAKVYHIDLSSDSGIAYPSILFAAATVHVGIHHTNFRSIDGHLIDAV